MYSLYSPPLLFGRLGHVDITNVAMAEIVATAASVVGFASLGLQLAECAVKLKSFYEDVEKAPKVLNRISREINTFALLLRQIDDTRARHGVADQELLEESIEICTECTQEITILTSKLDTIMRKYHLAGRMYSALRMRDVLDICANLERAKNSLMVAFQVFDHRTHVRMMDASHNLAVQQSLILLKHGEAIAQVREDTTALLLHASNPWERTVEELSDDSHPEVVSESTAAGSYGSVKLAVASSQPCNRKRPRRRPWKFRLPNWFSNQVWEVTANRSSGKWELCLQTYNHRPAYSRVVAHFLAGRAGAVRDMFERGEASPHDVYGGRNVLEVWHFLTTRSKC